MSLLSVEAKEAIVLKAINRGDETLASIAKTHNVGLSSLGKWLHRYREGKPLSTRPKNVTKIATLSRAEQFQHILATSHLDEVSLGEYCRKHGLYSYQLTQWRESFMSTPDKKNHQKGSEIKTLKAENKRLQRELMRKEKALAEASALLVMKKKADLIWGGDEDD